MNEQEKQNWREWLDTHQEWVMPLVEFFDKRPTMVKPSADKSMFWHDLAGVLAYAYGKHILKVKYGKELPDVKKEGNK